MANVKIYKRHFYFICRQGMTCTNSCNRRIDRHTDRQTDKQTERHTDGLTQTHAETDKKIAISEIWQICLKSVTPFVAGDELKLKRNITNPCSADLMLTSLMTKAINY